MPFLDVDGLALHYDVRGDGEPIVLLHGFTSSFGGNWERRGWVAFLAASGFRVMGLDFRSHGRSDRVFTPGKCTTATLANDVVRLLDHLHVDRAHVFGFSMGGGVALELAMDEPERVGRVVVGGVGDAALNPFHEPSEIDDIITAFEGRSPNAIASPTARRLRRNAEAAGNDLAALVPFLRNGGWPGGLDPSRSVTAPVLLLVAEQDQYMRDVNELVGWLAHARVQRVPADHYAVLDDDTVRAGVVRFLHGGPS